MVYASNGKKSAPFFSVHGISKKFGGVQALFDVSFSLNKGSITSMIGPNGAGKSTFINVATGIYVPDTGTISYKEREIGTLPAHVVADLGIGRTFQLEELFSSLSVLENAMVGCHTKSGCGMFSVGLKLPSARAEERRIREEAMANLDMIGLAHRASDPVSKIPLGERKLVGIARVLGMAPGLLMLDEPVGGLAAHETKKLEKVIHTLAENGLTVLIVEHNMPFVMSISQKIIVLDGGQKLIEETPEKVRIDKRVIKAYLGEES